MLFKKSSLGSNLVSVTIFKIMSNQRIVTLTFTLTFNLSSHSKWSQWTLCMISVGSSIEKNCYFVFWALKTIQGQIWLCQSKAQAFYIFVLPRSNLVTVTVFEIFRVKGFRLWVTFDSSGLSKVKFDGTKLDARLQQALLRHSAKFQPDCANGPRDVRHHFLIFWPWGVAPSRPKSEKIWH